MEMIILTAIVVGGSTVAGALIGLVLRQVGERYNEIVMSLTAGVMLAAAVIGLIIPAVEYGGVANILVCSLGIFSGAFMVNLFDRLLGLAYNLGVSDGERRRVFLFVAAIAAHNLPEGIAAGVGFSIDSHLGGLFIALAIALQNLPEGMAVTLALIGAGMRPMSAFLVASVTAVIEVIGTFVGFFACGISASLLPFVLSLAGGSMMYVINEEIIPHTGSRIGSRAAAYLILLGFCLMLLLGELI